MHSDDETRLLELLRESAATVKEAAAALPEHLARTKPAPDRWSVLECIEHICIVDSAFAARLESAEPGSELIRNPAKEEQLLKLVPVRNSPFQAPARAQPTGQFQTRDEVFQKFFTGEDQLAHLVNQLGPKLRYIRIDHPALGLLSGYEAVIVLAAHRLRHANQMVEVKEQLGESS